MRSFKPWTACARYLRPVLKELGAATPFLIEEGVSVVDWVKNLPFLELVLADDICKGCDQWQQSLSRSMLGDLIVSKEKEADELLRGRLATQVALRIYCVLDIARFGPHSMHKNLPWTGDVVLDVRYMLLVYWRDNGLWWITNYGNYHEPSS